MKTHFFLIKRNNLDVPFYSINHNVFACVILQWVVSQGAWLTSSGAKWKLLSKEDDSGGWAFPLTTVTHKSGQRRMLVCTWKQWKNNQDYTWFNVDKIVKEAFPKSMTSVRKHKVKAQTQIWLLALKRTTDYCNLNQKLTWKEKMKFGRIWVWSLSLDNTFKIFSFSLSSLSSSVHEWMNVRHTKTQTRWESWNILSTRRRH